jgi:mRNA-degrading endonuclease RelE of RelBE toxin-antitoxin system
VKILFSRKAEKYLSTLPQRIALQIISKIEKLPDGDIRPLVNRAGEYRLRCGNFRILFFIEDDAVKVYKIDTRGDVYKK